MDQLRTSSGSIIRGVWAPPKLLAEAKSDENERTKAESSGSNTPWAYRPGEFGFPTLADGGPIPTPLECTGGWYLRYCTQCITWGTRGGVQPLGKMHWGVGVKVEPINTKQTEVGPPPWYPR